MDTVACLMRNSGVLSVVCALLMVAFLASPAVGLECHVCNSHGEGEERCAELDGRTDFVKQCREGSAVCMKQITQTYVLKDGDSAPGDRIITRFCGMESWEGCEETEGARSLTTQCACKGDNCNTAATTAGTAGAVVLLAAAFSLLMVRGV